MAGVFDTTDLGGPQATPLTTKGGVEEPSALAALTPIVGAIAQRVMAPEETAKTPLSQFSTEQLAVADAVAQGAMTPSEGQARMRATVGKYIANNPNIEPKEFFDLQSNIVGTSGLGRVVTTGNKEFQEKEEALKQARTDGFVLPGMSSDEVEVGLQLSIQDRILNRNLEQQAALVRFNAGKVGLSASEAALQETKDRMNSRNYINAFAENKRAKIDLEVSTIARRAELPATDPNHLTREMAVQEFNRVKFNLQEQLRSLGPAAGGEYLSAAAKPTLDYIDSVVKVTTGELPKTIAENHYNASLKQTQLGLITEDKKLKTLVSLDNLFKNTPINLVKTVTDKTVEIYMRGSNGDAKEGLPQDLANPNNKEAVVPYLKGIEFHNQEYVSGKYDDTAKQQVDNNNESIIKSVAAAKNSDAEELMPLVNYLSSPSFGQYVRAHGGLPVGAADATLVLDRQYKEQILPLIQDRIREKEVILGQLQPKGASRRGGIEDYVDVSFRGEGVTFSLADTTLDETTRGRVKAEVDSLNKTVAPHLTKMSRLAANFNQTSPKSEWDTMKELLFKPERIKEEAPAAPQAPVLHPEDVEWVKAATTLEEKKRRAQVLGIAPEMIEQATRGR